MRILHVNSTDTDGGAARGAYWLHQALLPHEDSMMLVQRKLSQDTRVHEYRPRWSSAVSRRVDGLALRPYHKQGTFSPVVWQRSVHHQIQALQPDVVNLHWVGDGFLSPESAARINAPLVWTLRDLWPLTGGCHYPGPCDGFTRGCGRCPALNSRSEHDLSRLLYRRKLHHWRTPMTLVALSRWVAGQVQRSPLLGHQPVHVIPNALDVQVFQPQERQQVRSRLGLAPEERVLLFVATNPLGDPRKGFTHLMQTCEMLARQMPGKKLKLLVVGPTYGHARPAGVMPTRYLGAVNDDRILAGLYSAADVTVMPSLEEAFGKVAMESLACGTPVVAYAGTGAEDIVLSGQNGELAPLGNVPALARSLKVVLTHPQPDRLAAQARQHVLNHFTFEIQVQAYRDVYAQAILHHAAYHGAHHGPQYSSGRT